MTLLVSSCWFFLASSLIFLINFMSRRISRILIGNSDKRDDDKDLKTSVTQSEAELSDNTHSDNTSLNSTLEDELSGFIFKFEHQISDHGFISKEESSLPSEDENESNYTTRIHNYRFSAEKGFSGFMMKPEVETFLVQESYVHPESSCLDDKEVCSERDPSFLSDKCQKQHKVEDVKNTTADIIIQKMVHTNESSKQIEMLVKNPSESDADAFGKIRNENGTVHTMNMNDPDSPKMIDVMSLNQDNYLNNSEVPKEYLTETNAEPLCKVVEENGAKFSQVDFSSSNMDSEFQDETDDFSLKDLNVELDDKEDRDGKTSTSILSPKDYKQVTVEASEHGEIGIRDTKLETRNDRFMYSKQLEEENLHTTSLDRFKKKVESVRFFSEEFSGFNSDSESLNSESDGYSVKDLIVDSDGFLSERDFDGCELETATMGDDTGYSKLKVEPSKLLHDYPVPVDTSHDLNSADILDERLPEIDSYNHALQQKELPNGATETSQVENFGGAEPSSNSAHIEFTDSSDNELCSVKHGHGLQESVHAAMDTDDLLDHDVAGMHSFDYISPNSSKNTLDASINSLPNPTNGLEQDSTFLRRDMDAESTESDDNFTNQGSEEHLENSEEAQLNDLNEEDLDELESLWEHQDLIEQLKMELRRVKAIGLPTILEESDTNKTVEDLKPWKIDENFSHENPMDELQKFYKSYREKMRKLDILSYQKMYAIGFLQLKDPLESMVAQKPIIPTLTSILSQNIWSIHSRSSKNESNMFIKELRYELELVYVAQTCLSWEFLRWQYEKSRELPEADPYGNKQYNQVAGDFQQFQVLLQRFIEDERFQGPRLPSYVKTRCVTRNLLQVPVIREDSLKDKMVDQKKGNFIVTNEVLEDIMEETIRLFWEFVKADKVESPAILKALRGTHAELQDPSDLRLMLDIQSDLQKKTKKLKDILRTGNCLVKKFKKPKEDRSNQDLFFSQVDLKLVARVLRMSRITTDQLLWCHKKLNKIMIVDRKVYREPSFLVFPC